MPTASDWVFYGGVIWAAVFVMAIWAEVERRQHGKPRFGGVSAVRYYLGTQGAAAALTRAFALVTEGRGCYRTPCPYPTHREYVEYHW